MWEKRSNAQERQGNLDAVSYHTEGGVGNSSSLLPPAMAVPPVFLPLFSGTQSHLQYRIKMIKATPAQYLKNSSPAFL